MPIVDDVDCGAAVLNIGPNAGAAGSVATVVGSRESVTITGRRAHVREETFNIQANSAVGPNAAGTKAAAKATAVQLQEMVGSVRHVFWESGGGITAASPWDGWWRLDDVEPQDFTWLLHLPVRVKATLVALDSGPLAVQRFGSTLITTGYSGAAQELVAFPFNAGNQPATTITRTGGEGSIPCSINPATTSSPFTVPATFSDIFKGRIRAFDTRSAGGNAIPVGVSGSWTNANWIEAYGPDHVFVGDAVITNGLVALVFSLGTARICRTYTWIAGTGWQQGPDVAYNDNASNAGSLRSFRVIRSGWQAFLIRARASTSAGNWSEVRIRLGRSRYHGLMTLQPLTQANTNPMGLALVPPTSTKVVFTESGASDLSGGGVATTSLAPTSTYGYAGAVLNTAGSPIFWGLLWRVPPNSAQPQQATGGAIGIGETTGPALNEVRTYGFFVVPFAQASLLQAEAESGTLTGGFVSAVDAAASGGHVAKLPSGNAATGIAIWGTAFTPETDGLYNVWTSMKVTSTASASAFFRFGLRDVTAGAYTASVSLAPNAMATSFVWIKSATGLGVTAGHTYQFEADNNLGVAPTDWVIDQAFLALVSFTGDYRGPQDIWQQFKADYDYDLARAA